MRRSNGIATSGPRVSPPKPRRGLTFCGVSVSVTAVAAALAQTRSSGDHPGAAALDERGWLLGDAAFATSIEGYQELLD